MRGLMQKATRIAAAGGLGAALSLFAVATPAMADQGDGIKWCDPGEICLDWANPAGPDQRDFWYGGTDDGNYYNVVGGYTTEIVVHDSASSAWNRDTQCDVLEVNYSGQTVVGSQWFSHTSGDWVGFNNSIQDKNDAHWRCSLNGH
jgi:hypothetical protein